MGASGSGEERRGLLAAAGAAILYGASYPATAVALRSFSPLAIAGLACTLALPFVIGAAAGGSIARPSRAAANRASLIRLAVLGLLGGVAFIAAMNIAVALSGSTVTGFVAPLYAVTAALLAIPILGERLRPVTAGAFGLAIVGTALLAGVDPTATSLVGIGFAVLAALAFGLYIVLARRWGVRYGLDGTLVTIANLIGRGPLLLLVEVARSSGELVPTQPDQSALLALLFIALGPSSSANLLLMASVRRVPARATSAALLLVPVSSAVISAILFGEVLTAQGVLGAVLILVGIAAASGLTLRSTSPRIAA